MPESEDLGVGRPVLGKKVMSGEKKRNESQISLSKEPGLTSSQIDEQTVFLRSPSKVIYPRRAFGYLLATAFVLVN